MTDLKPCPFCGGEGTFSTVKLHNYSSDMSFYVDCDTCGCSTSYKDTGAEVINLWNTRQSSDNWKPIEELTEEVFLTESHFLFYYYMNNVHYYSVGNRVSYDKLNGGTDEMIWLPCDSIFYESIKKFPYTHFAILTPPNQELKND